MLGQVAALRDADRIVYRRSTRAAISCGLLQREIFVAA